MSMIRCPECHQEISDKAQTCIHCGYPIDEYLKANTKCSFKGVNIDFSDIVARFENKYSEDIFHDLAERIKQSNIDMSNISICNFLQDVMTTHIIPIEYNQYATQTDFIAYVRAELPKNSKCIIKENNFSYDFSIVKDSLVNNGKLDTDSINFVMSLPELTIKESSEFVDFLNENKYIPWSYPYDTQVLAQLDAINNIIEYWNKENLKQSIKESIQPSNVPHCPSCHSTNIQKIGLGGKMGILGLGLLSSNVGKTFKCKNCGYKW